MTPRCSATRPRRAGPDYLRMVTLDTFDGVQWQPAVLRARAAAQVADGLPDPPGLSDDVRRSRVTTTIKVGPLEENRLPLPYPAAQVDIEGDWRYDEATLNVLTPDEGRTTEDTEYTVVSVQPVPTAAQLRAAGQAARGRPALHRASAGHPARRPARRGGRRRRPHGLRRRGRTPVVVPGRGRVRLRPDRAAPQRRRAGRLPHRSAGVLPAVRRGVRGDGPAARDPGPGERGLRPRAPRPTTTAGR